MVSTALLSRRRGRQGQRPGVFASILVSVLLASPARAAALDAADVGDVFFFGDSISDTGNGCFLPFLLPVSFLDECQDARYFLGRTTQGPVWAEVLASNLTGTPLVGLPLNQLVELDPGPPPSPEAFFAPFFPGQMAVSSAPPASLAFFGSSLGLPPETLAEIFSSGANLAVAGAETADLLPDPGDPFPNPLASELGAFLALVELGVLMPTPADLFVVWAGGNDVRRSIKDGQPVDIQGGVARILATMGELSSRVGAQRFLTPGLPDVGLSLDLDEGQRVRATAATKEWNEVLAAALAGFAASNDVEVVPLDAFCLTEALIDFGRLDTESSCLESDDYPICRRKLLFDDIHATSVAHRTFGIGGQAALECHWAGSWPGGQRRCVARVTREQVWRGFLPLAGAWAINRCVGGRQHAVE